MPPTRTVASDRYAADPLQLRHGDDGCADVFPAPV